MKSAYIPLLTLRTLRNPLFSAIFASSTLRKTASDLRSVETSKTVAEQRLRSVRSADRG
jgi:hypothetical protein